MLPKVPQSFLGILRVPQLTPPLEHPPPIRTLQLEVATEALGGIGLTVALFVANEAFVQPEMRGQAAWIWLFPFQSCLAVGACRHSQNTGPQIVDVHNRCIHFLACIEPDVFPRRCFVKAKMGAVLSILCGLIAFVINRIFSKGTGFHGNSDPDRLFCAHKNLQWNEIFQLILRYTQVFVVRCESFRSVCHFSAGVPPLYIDLFGSQLQHQQKQDVFHCEL